jgi:hypothetical protein
VQGNDAHPNSHFRFALGFATLVLAHELDSLVRVSRRGREKDIRWDTIQRLQLAPVAATDLLF